VYLRFEVLTVVKMSIVVFWVLMPCGLVGGHQRVEDELGCVMLGYVIFGIFRVSYSSGSLC
jgi:hypothetical protein